MKITIFGVGYVGLVTGTCLSEVGNLINCIDIDKTKINQLRKSKVPFHEPGLDIILKKNIEKGNLKFSTSVKQDINESDLIFICVGTPDDGKEGVNLHYIYSAADNIIKKVTQDATIFVKSTVPVGTCSALQKYINKELADKGKKIEVEVASNPEFLKEGSAINDFNKPDRIIVGTDNEPTRQLIERLYEPFNRKSKRMIFMSKESSEMTKYVANSFLATKISFINEISVLSELTGANIEEVRRGVGSDNRIGNQFLYPGLGYGGSCFPKDVNGLLETAKKYNTNLNIISAAKKVNDNHILYFENKILSFFKKQTKDKTISIWGLSFKPETDDIRESKSLHLISHLSKSFKSINVYDPIAINNAKKELISLKNIKFYKDPYTATKRSSGLIIATEWSEFWEPDFVKLNKGMKEKVIFDGRNILNVESVKESGFTYIGIGK